MYDYHCPECGVDFEAMTDIEYRDHMTCDCGAYADRQITGGAFVLKGEGWTGGHDDR